MIRWPLVILAAFAPFVFPWPLAILFMLIAAAFMPLSALFVGILTDSVYYDPGSGSWPIATLSGVFIFIIGLLVHRFVKNRMMVE